MAEVASDFPILQSRLSSRVRRAQTGEHSIIVRMGFRQGHAAVPRLGIRCMEGNVLSEGPSRKAIPIVVVSLRLSIHDTRPFGGQRRPNETTGFDIVPFRTVT